MDLGDITQLALVATVVLIMGRVGFAVARLIERRGRQPELTAAAEDRLRRLEDECAELRHDLTDVFERQDFTERALLRDPLPPRAAPAEDVLTPH